jgi:hypothetical protein
MRRKSWYFTVVAPVEVVQDMKTTVQMVFVVVLGGCAHAVNQEMVSKGGVLSVTNATREEVEVSCNGAYLGVLKPKEMKEFDRLLVGECRLEAVGLVSRTRHETVTTLDKNVKKSWRVDETKEQKEALDAIPKGKIKIQNFADEPIRVKIDDQPKELVWKSAEALYDGIIVGKHNVRAEGAKSGFVVEAQVEVASGTTPVVQVFPPQGTLEITNSAPLEANVVVGDDIRMRLKPGETRRLPNLRVGQYQVRAEDNRFRVLFEGVAIIKAGELKRIDVKAPEGVLAVVSEIDDGLRIMADGRVLGDVPPKGGAEFQGLPIGQTKVKAFSSDGVLVGAKELSIPAEGKALWFIKRGTVGEGREGFGQIRIRNIRDEPVRVRIDGWERGEIGRGKDRLFVKMPVGEHLVEVFGVRSKDVFKALVLVEEGGDAVVTTSVPTASVAVKNKRDEVVRLLVDGEVIATLAPQEEATVLLSAGNHVFEHKGLSTKVSAIVSVAVTKGIPNKVELLAPFGSIKISNGFTETLHVVVDGIEVGAVEPQSEVTFKGVQAGKHKVTLKAQQRPLEWSRDVVVKEGDVWAWKVPE